MTNAPPDYESRTQLPAPIAYRSSGQRMTDVEAEEFSYQAYELVICQRKSLAQASREMKMGPGTIKKLLEHREQENRKRFHNRLDQQIATYELVARYAFETYTALAIQGNTTAQNRVASLNAITNALTRIDILLGLEAPRKSDVTTRFEGYDLSKVPSTTLKEIVAHEDAIKELMTGVIQGEG